ncbi:MAG: FxsA family protein [Bradymonadales bacterium]|nr:FxsA family protein [Bradymonadales bacterium]
MLIKILLLLTLVPIAELVILIEIGKSIGLLPTIGIILGTGVVGAVLAHWQGLRIVRKIRSEIFAGRVPGDPILHGLLVLIAGALLLTPGLLTDIAGLLLLVPPIQRRLSGSLKRYFLGRIKSGQAQFHVHRTEEVDLGDHSEDDPFVL